MLFFSDYVAYTVGLCNICVNIKCSEFCSQDVFLMILWAGIISTLIINRFVFVIEKQVENEFLYTLLFDLLSLKYCAQKNSRFFSQWMQTLYRSGQSPRVPGVLSFHISRQLAHEGGKYVSLTRRPPLLPRKYSRYSFPSEVESTSGP